MATERHRRNSIASLKLPDGKVINDHAQMEGIIWNCFKNRMGTSRGIVMGFHPSDLITPVEGLDILTKPFEKDEIDKDFYELAQEFYEGGAIMDNINDSYITLVPKKVAPKEDGDYRPISLTSMGLKFLSKMAANRIQEILRHKGFNEKWILWMKQLLGTDDTLIILPADRIQLLALKDMLQVFSQSTGLDVNYHKSFLIPINVDPIVMNDLAVAFGCQIGKMPFTYLGLPFGCSSWNPQAVRENSEAVFVEKE
ncbi:uncharacterized protein [Aegilops tauschii subsp. strangulata]|uniref:uncharacterized protein n=1 Tax=Aegilops tauschii subsp. strangulata TaxID=200361 RepID=UPI00098B34A9|nr:uncharacterized protein LOC123494904 [Aegilops tauschii subsp. strangulata]